MNHLGENTVPGSAAGGPARYKQAGKGLLIEKMVFTEGFANRHCFARTVPERTLPEVQLLAKVKVYVCNAY